MVLFPTGALLLAVHERDPLSTLPAIPFRALAENPMVLFPTGARPNFVDKVMALCHERGFEPLVSQEVGDAVTGVALVASGFGVCLVPESATTLKIPGVTYRSFIDAPSQAFVDLSCIFRLDDQSPILRAFLDTVRRFRDSELVRP